MANVLRLSKFTATKHPATVQSLLRQIHRFPLSFNLRFAPNLDLSRSSLKITNEITKLMKPPKSSSIHFAIQPMINHEADLSPIWANAILKPLKKCTIPLLIMAVLLMSYPDSAWAASIMWYKSASQRLRSGELVARSESATETAAVAISFLLLLLSSAYINYRVANEDWVSTSVLKLQVGLSGKARSLQRDLKLIAEIPCSSTCTIQSRVLTGTIHALLCHPDYCISAYSCVHVEYGVDEGIRKLRQLFKEERAKFSEEQRHNPTILRAGEHNHDYIVVTIWVAVRGIYTIPTIKGSMDLKNALETLESIPPLEIRDVEVLWTPQAENKTLSEKELGSYPLLKPL